MQYPLFSDTISIPLTQGKFALIDIIDQDLLQFNWFFTQGYATRRLPGPKTSNKFQRLHRNIQERKLGRSLTPGELVDHIDGNPLNNRRSNLRVATHAQNAMNSRKQAGTSSIYKGVHIHTQTGKWSAVIVLNRKTINLGLYNTPEEAAIIYNEAAIHYHGEFANINKGLPDIQVKSSAGQLHAQNKSGYRGVNWDKQKSKWVAELVYQNKHYYCGSYSTPQEAAQAYNEMARHLGLHNRLNPL